MATALKTPPAKIENMILDDIVEAKTEELAERKQTVPLTALQERIRIQFFREPDFTTALKGDSVRLIAEVKKASPSRGVICPNFDPIELARTYAHSGASAISVLTEERYFGGSLEHLSAISQEMEKLRVGGAEVDRKERIIPVLRKDFIFDPYQVYESKAYGAAALLLIVTILSNNQLTELLTLSHELGMKCLVEVHNEAEMERAVMSGAQIIGINNRDLKTFAIDLETTRRLRPLIPQDRIVVSESGIKDRGDVQKLQQWGVDAMLVGEALVAAGDVAEKVRELL
jgi:indole-3-glycerol phosphate synthase